MEGDKGFKWFVAGFVVLVLAVAFITSIASQTNSVTQKTNVVNEGAYDLSTLGCLTADGQVNESAAACNITVTNAPTGWKSEDCPLTSVVVGNDTTDLTVSTDYNLFASTGVIQLLNTTSTENGTIGNDVYVDYTYCGNEYLNSAWGRSVLSSNVGLFALAILVFIVGVVYLILDYRKRDDD